MERVAFKMKLFEGYQIEYKRRHEDIWPALRSLLKSKGIQDYSIFLNESTGELFAFLTAPTKQVLEDLGQEAIMLEWWEFMQDIMETNEDHSPRTIPLTEVFYFP